MGETKKAPTQRIGLIAAAVFVGALLLFSSCVKSISERSIREREEASREAWESGYEAGYEAAADEFEIHESGKIREEAYEQGREDALTAAAQELKDAAKEIAWDPEDLAKWLRRGDLTPEEAGELYGELLDLITGIDPGR